MSRIFDIKFSIDSGLAVEFSLNHARAFGGPGASPRRSSETLKDEGKRLVQEAMESVIYALADTSMNELIVSETALTTQGQVKDIEKAKDKDRLVKLINEDLTVALTAYLASRGPFTEQRFWLLATDKLFKIGKEEKRVYIGFPTISSGGNHGAIITAFCEPISAYLAAGGPSSIISFCAASGIEIHSTKKRFAFKKGMHVKNFPEGQHRELLNDLKVIFAQMNGAKGSADLSAVTWLTKPISV